jgi:4-amino-4-deoxy-L-arabinose transferase-like glycosyltransferase
MCEARLTENVPVPANDRSSTAETSDGHAFALFALALVGRWHLFVAPDALVLGWRQADMLSVTRNFVRNGYALFWPQVDWGGAGPGFVEMELPILPWLGAVFQRLAGPSEYVAALLPLAASFGLVFAVAALTRRIFGPRAGLWAGAFTALSPLASWQTASFIPDGTMLLASVLGVLLLLGWTESGRTSELVASAACTSLAVLLKPTALLVGLPLLYLFRLRWGSSTPRRALFWLYGALAIIPAAQWYTHAHALYATYGNTFGVLSGGYQKLSSLALLTGRAFWPRLAGRTIIYLLTPAVAALWIAGLFRGPRGPAGLLFHVWTAAGLLYVLLVGRGNFDMEHYQLPLLPPAAALAGTAAADLAERLSGRRVLRAAAAAVLAASLVGAHVAHARRVVLPDVSDSRLLRANGREVARVTAPGSLIVVTTAYGDGRAASEIDTPPEVFAHADRRGWFLSLSTLTPAAVETRREAGAAALVVPAEALRRFTGATADALKERYPALPTAADVLVLDLRGAPTPLR